MKDKIALIAAAFGTIFIVMIGLSWVAGAWQTLKLPGPAPAIPAGGRVPEVRTWRDIGQRPIVSDSFEVSRVLFWTNGSANASPNLKVSLRGRFTGSEPLVFVVMDAENAARWKAGNPPLLAYGINQDQEINTPLPGPGSIYGFVRPEQQQAQGIPTSLSQLALRIVGQVAQQNRPPARVTLELRAEGQCFCTELEAQKARR